MGQAGSNNKRSPNDIQTFLEKEKEKFIEKIENPMRQNAALDDFELVRTVGTGSFGNRHLLEEEDKGFIFSLQVVFFSSNIGREDPTRKSP